MKKLIQEFEGEHRNLESAFESTIRKKNDERRDVENKIHLRQVKLDEMFKENYSFFHSHYLQMVCSQSKSMSESLLEFIRTFNSNQSSNEYAVFRNSSILLNNLLFDFKLDNLLKTSEQVQLLNSFKSIFKNHSILNSDLKSQAFIFESLFNSYCLIKQKLNDVHSFNSIELICNSSENLVKDYEVLLAKCVNNDRLNLDKYLAEIQKRLSIFNGKYNLDFIIEVGY